MQKKEGRKEEKKEGKYKRRKKRGRISERNESEGGDVLSHKILVTPRSMYRAALETTP